MKYLVTFLVSLVIGFGLSFTLPNYNPSTEDQTARLVQVLNRVEKPFKLNEYLITVQVNRMWELKAIGCDLDWGCTRVETAEIHVIDIRDLPPSMPWLEREAFQNKILQHEVMHLALTQVGVPGDAQDTLIRALQPALTPP